MATKANQRSKLDAFFHAHSRVQYKKGEIIIRAEDEPSGIFLIEWGFIKAYTTTKYGEENVMLIRSSGSIFPLIWAFTGEHRSIVYEAMEPTSLWRVSKADYLDFLEKNQHIMPLILDMSIEAYQLHSERVITLSYRTAKERIVSFLLTCAKRWGVEKKSGTDIVAPLRQVDIACSVNATRETTSRVLNNLKKRGLIETNQGYIRLKNLKELQKIL